MPKVYVVGGDHLTEKMFKNRGYTVTTKKDKDVDLVCFTGGEDVSPYLYQELPHPATYSNSQRDSFEEGIFMDFLDTPKVGICRGGQFLNVKSGGSMWQDVNNHGRTHEAFDKTGLFKDKFRVTSTHHQMMRMGSEGILLTTAKLATRFEGDKNKPIPTPEFDTEAIYYPDTASLCFQPHPEYLEKGEDCEEYFFKLLSNFFGV